VLVRLTARFLSLRFIFFFFQAEDGIRDRNVTGVQTCALPIYSTVVPMKLAKATFAGLVLAPSFLAGFPPELPVGLPPEPCGLVEIGRASCRERVEIWVGGGG